MRAMGARVFICDANPRMRQVVEGHVEGHAEIVGSGATPDDAIAAAAELDPDAIVLDFRTAVGDLTGTINAIQERRPGTTAIVHSGVPRHLIEDMVEAAGGIFAAKNEPERLVQLIRASAAKEAASRGS